jgi:hypothetical protein
MCIVVQDRAVFRGDLLDVHIWTSSIDAQLWYKMRSINGPEMRF